MDASFLFHLHCRYYRSRPSPIGIIFSPCFHHHHKQPTLIRTRSHTSSAFAFTHTAPYNCTHMHAYNYCNIYCTPSVMLKMIYMPLHRSPLSSHIPLSTRARPPIQTLYLKKYLHIHRRIPLCFSGILLHVFPFFFPFQNLLSVVLTSILLFGCCHLIYVSLSSERLLCPLYIFTTTPKSYVKPHIPSRLTICALRTPRRPTSLLSPTQLHPYYHLPPFYIIVIYITSLFFPHAFQSATCTAPLISRNV